ncbi:serine protease trypsin-like protein [Phytophthora sojae]|uniref:Serine protease trypsin-like protein n=1 Tax=Phytophthora sojae (strain P6497) TaxID=1094619 RepID=G5AE39_PHYSP|nr:serine protease trypsin-like protein [Phytophthora sojae]EGZ06441.1 serine protease trypsin-like protein [Phytophthora sojae]|eukprot:XP_009538338.1 serine protease trypsin-like protein [Phytophthora sojae]
MNIISAIAASMALGAADTQAEHVERALIVGGGEVSIGSKTYTSGLRATPESNSFCSGALISPIHVLTAASCTGYRELGFVAVGTHCLNGTLDGEAIKVMGAKNHTLYNSTSLSYDFAVLMLEKPSKFTPVKPPKADHSNITPGMWSSALGWGISSYPNRTDAYELQSLWHF